MSNAPRRTPHPDRTHILARYGAWEHVAYRHEAVGRSERADAAGAIARRLARAYREPARADLVARGAVLDVSRW